MPTHTGSARYEGFGKDGKGQVSTQSGVLSDQPYGLPTEGTPVTFTVSPRGSRTPRGPIRKN